MYTVKNVLRFIWGWLIIAFFVYGFFFLPSGVDFAGHVL